MEKRTACGSTGGPFDSTCMLATCYRYNTCTTAVQVQIVVDYTSYFSFSCTVLRGEYWYKYKYSISHAVPVYTVHWY